MTVMSEKLTSLPNKNGNLKVLTSSSEPKKIQNTDTTIVESGVTRSQTFNKIDYLKSDKPFVIARFIFECGTKLEAKVLTISTALKLLHQFRRNTHNPEYDPYLICAACIYLAGKIEENDNLRIRDIINVVYTTLHRDRYETLHLYYYFGREGFSPQ